MCCSLEQSRFGAFYELLKSHQLSRLTGCMSAPEVTLTWAMADVAVPGITAFL